MIRKDIIVFVICLMISFILWIIHQLNQTYIRNYDTNVVIYNVPDVYQQDSIHVSLKIKVKGSGLKIKLLEKYLPHQIYIPFNKLKRINKKGLYSIRNENISENDHFPVRINILEIQPDTISIKFDKTSKKRR
ncbi:MAG: hypothetical protein KatS3mg027_0402 [Bacteroidia bacterium]|nr:MAG: hypothetical protein KatS3mg027_0402 [Bacteroidia bacterium]